jgi:hypothetical protein
MVSAATIDSTTANLVEIAPPASVVEGALESNTLAYIFAEQQDYTLTSELFLDTVGFPPGAIVASDGSGGSPGSLPPGTRIDSFYVHRDSVGQPVDSTDVSWSVTFVLGDEIIGLIYSDSLLDASDYLGAVGTTNPTGASFRGTTGASEGVDDLLWGQLRVVQGTQSVTVEVDAVRIIFLVPEPATVGLAIAAVPVLLLVGFRLRRR